jgi:lipopolysaccharide export system protein LptA
MIIRADRVEVRQDNEGFQFGTASSTGGKRAFFRQKRDSGDEWIEGEGETIVYDGKADTVSFNRNANLRRLRGAAITDETQGALILTTTPAMCLTSRGATPQALATPAGACALCSAHVLRPALLLPPARRCAPAPRWAGIKSERNC